MTVWWLVLVGAACILAAWFYTGGPRPYGYAGFGEVFVFVFFGLVAVLGTTYVQARTISVPAVAAGIGIGLLACALLVANNLRDVQTDAKVGKRTLAVILGAPMTRRMYGLIIAVAFLAIIVIGITHPWCLLALLAAPLAVAAVRSVLAGATGRDLIAVLGATGRLELVYAVALTVGLLLRLRTRTSSAQALAAKVRPEPRPLVSATGVAGCECVVQRGPLATEQQHRQWQLQHDREGQADDQRHEELQHHGEQHDQSQPERGEDQERPQECRSMSRSRIHRAAGPAIGLWCPAW